MASKRIDLSINGKNNLKSAFDSASNDVKKFANDVKSAGGKLTMSAGFNKIVSEARSAMEKIKSFFSGLGGVLASAFAGFSIGEIVTSSGQVEAKWNRIAAATGSTTQQIAGMKTNMRAIADHYGVINGELSSIYETNLRFYGDQERSMRLTEGIAATSKRTGTEMETIQQALLSGELGRNKALQRSVLTEAQRNKYLADGQLTQEEINAVMEENIGFVEQNTALVEDQEAAWNRAMNSVNALKTTIGRDLGPVIEAAAGFISKMADGFKAVDDATGGVLGSITGIGLGVVALGAPLAFIGKGATSLARSTAAAAVAMWDYAAASKVAQVTGNPAPGKGGSVTPVATSGSKANLAGDIGALVAITVLLNGVQNAWDQISFSAEKTNNTFTQASAGLMSFVNSISPIHMVMNALAGVDTSLAGVQASAQRSTDAIYRGWYDLTHNITARWNEAKAAVIGSWNSLVSGVKGAMASAKSAVSGAWNGIKAAAQNAINVVRDTWNGLVSLVSGGVSATVSFFQSGLSAVQDAWNWITSNVHSFMVTIGMSPSGPGGPRGPGGPGGPEDLSYNYENYPGWQKNAWSGSSSMSGNCADMTTGLIQRYGGSMVSGTWNGNPHVWYKSPTGREYDPARKALNGTFSPPPRGPTGSSSGNTYVFQGDIYGFDDFQAKVEKANNKIMRSTI